MASSARHSALQLLRGMSVAAAGGQAAATGHARGILCRVYNTEHLEQILSGDFVMPPGWAFGHAPGTLHKKYCGVMKSAPNSMAYQYKDAKELEQLLTKERLKKCKRCDKYFNDEFVSPAAVAAAGVSKVASKAAQTVVNTAARRFASEAVRRLLKKSL